MKEDWAVRLNGKTLGALFLMEEELVQTLRVPAGSLRQGSNLLEIIPKTPEDILIKEIALADCAKEELLKDCVVGISVRERGSDEKIPCRITIVDSKQSLAALNDFGETNHLAARPGVVYTADGSARVGLLPGSYTIYATRGPEYSLGITNVTLSLGTNMAVGLTLARVVNTRGWVSADTHIHTYTFSRHGDATLEERVMTLAGENVEVAVATEHNQHANFAPAVEKLGLSKYFTVVNGNEVTTAKGHFNIFPVSLSATPPDFKNTDWPELLKQIRATPEVKVVILNHPTDTHVGFTPFASTNFNRVTGKNLRGFKFTFDAMEVINSGAMRSDWMEPFKCWFALLNRGERVVGVCGSDSHDVSRFIVGQGRTYIEADYRDPGAIDIEKVCENLRAGRAVMSLGLFPGIKVNGRAGPGDVALIKDKEISIEATVDCPEVDHAGKS